GASDAGSQASTVSNSTRAPLPAHACIAAPSDSTPSSRCGDTTTTRSPRFGSSNGASTGRTMIVALEGGWRRFVPAGARRRLRPVRARYVAWRRRRPLDLGDLRRLTPIDPNWGFERGTPIDRVYVERFVGEHAGDIRGRVLEIA